MNDLDKLYAKYGELVALAEQTSHNTRMAYYDKADGVLTAIRILEGADHLVKRPDVSRWAAKVRSLLGCEVEVTLDYERPTVLTGTLISIGDGGDFGLREDDGFINWGWPALEISRVTE